MLETLIAETFPAPTPEELQAFQERIAEKGLELEPGNEGEGLDYLGVLFIRTCERLDRENAKV